MTNSTARKRLAETTDPTDEPRGREGANLHDWARSVAAATPCACSAQRARAAAAEGRLERVRALAENAAEFYSPALRVAAVPASDLLAALDEGPR